MMKVKSLMVLITVNIIAVIDGVTRFVPLAEGNMHYDTIMELVKSGDLTIADAE